MIISGKELKPGMVITSADFNEYYNKPESLNTFSLVLGLDSAQVNKRLEKLKEAVQSSYISRPELINKMNSIMVTVITLGNIYLNVEKLKNNELSDCDKASMQYLKSTILKILNNGDIHPDYTKLTYVSDKFYVVEGLCIKEQDLKTWILKKKLMDKDIHTYLSFKEYTDAAMKIIACKEDDFTFNDNVKARVCDMLQGNNLQKVKVFKPGELILRITAKRARLMLVLGPNIDNMTALLEVTNGTHNDYTSSSYYAQNYISHIVSAFKRKQPELANLEYYDTGFNVYDRFKDSIKRELNYNIADEFSF